MIIPNYPRVIPLGESANKRKKILLYMYVKHEALLPILTSSKLRLSKPWLTNDITECILKNEICMREETKMMGYLCFSSRCDSPAMWGYYASRGRGACLEFQFDVIEVQPDVYEILFCSMMSIREPLYLHPVRYSESRIDNSSAYSSFFVKSSEWKHEQEYRVVVPLSDRRVSVEQAFENGSYCLNHYISGFLDCLVRVILGPYSPFEPSEVHSYIGQLIKNRQVCFSRKIGKITQNAARLDVLSRVFVYKASSNKHKFSLSIPNFKPFLFDIDCISCYSYSIIYLYRKMTRSLRNIIVEEDILRLGVGPIIGEAACFEIALSSGLIDSYSVWHVEHASSILGAYLLIKETEYDSLYVLPEIDNLAELIYEANFHTKEFDSNGEYIIDANVYIPALPQITEIESS